jgi:hypothetical protein
VVKHPKQRVSANSTLDAGPADCAMARVLASRLAAAVLLLLLLLL